MLWTASLRKEVNDAGVVDGNEGKVGAVRLQLHHLPEFEITRVAVEEAGESSNGGRAEQGAQCHAAAKPCLDAREHAGSQQRVAAELKEVGCRVDIRLLQQLAPDRSQLALHGGIDGRVCGGCSLLGFF